MKKRWSNKDKVQDEAKCINLGSYIADTKKFI